MKEVYIPSTDGKHQLHITIWEPDVPAIGIVQISHGMLEYIFVICLVIPRTLHQSHGTGK